MSGWREGLMPGSWRGVPFLCRDTSNDAGQRLAKFEFPDSDQVYVQGLGRGIKEYRLEIYVIGDDYFTQRDALETALDADGPGTLVHPYRGPLQVYCQHPVRLKESAAQGRAAFVEAVFVEAGAETAPSPNADTAGASTAAAGNVTPQLGSGTTPASQSAGGYDWTQDATPAQRQAITAYGQQTGATSAIVSQPDANGVMQVQYNYN